MATTTKKNKINNILKNVNIAIYKLTQESLIIYVQNYLKERKIKFFEYEGNIISLRKNNCPIFIAHMDTVNDKDLSKKLYLDTNKNILYRKNGILGADDRAGVNLILNHCKDINFILTVDEEIGGLGIEEVVRLTTLTEHLENYSCCIELDRMGKNDLLGAKHGYCEKDLDVAIQKVLPKYQSEFGVFTDIDYLCDYIASANISVGYYQQHTKNEFLKVDEFDYINSKIFELSKIKGKFKISSNYNNWYTKYKDDDIDKYYEKEWEDYYKNVYGNTENDYYNNFSKCKY
jgi:hypothetical protein